MQNRIKRILEYDKVIEKVGSFCRTEDGLSMTTSLDILLKIEDIVRRQNYCQEARECLLGTEAFPIVTLVSLEQILKTASAEGSTLEGTDLNTARSLLTMHKNLKYFFTRNKNAPSLESLCIDSEILVKIEDQIAHVIDSSGEIIEKNIPALLKIRNRMRDLKKEIEDKVRGYMKTESAIMQQENPVFRDGRVMLPVKSNFKGRITGLVHEVSATGATIFIEPSDLVEKNNQAVEIDHEYARELHKVFRNLTILIHQNLALFKAVNNAISSIDMFTAMARWSIENDAYGAQSGTSLRLGKARHPLLGKKAIPVDIRMPQGKKVLIITGPNTGGKTVALKTIGLLVLLNQTGIFIPALEGSGLPVFDAVFADIGDEQSIEQSLSTFSGHMKYVSELLKGSTQDSLILLDELGAGTDPEEGSALAMSILDECLERQAMTFVTTHHGLLKHYGYTHPLAENACMEFSADTLSPTYRLITGIPGESRALDIAQKNGMPQELVDRARGYLKNERGDIGLLIKNLEDKQYDLERESRAQAALGAQVIEQKKEVDQKLLQLKQKERILRQEGVADLSRFISQARSTMENLIRSLKEEGLKDSSTKEIKDFLDTLDEAHEEQKNLIEDLFEQREEFHAGELVRIVSSGMTGTILEARKKDRYLVMTGNVRLELKAHEMELKIGKTEEKPSRNIGYTYEGESRTSFFEADLRGLYAEECLTKLEKIIDDALLAGMSEIAIIHGKGEGVLRSVVHDYLLGNRHIKDFAFSDPRAGGFGKTIVRLV